MRPACIALALLAGCQSSSSHWSTVATDHDRIVLSAWGAASGDRFFAGGSLGGTAPGLALHFDGAAWKDLGAPTTSTLWWVFGLDSKQVWFVGENGTILRWDGSAFSTDTSGVTATIYGIWGAAMNDLWAVGGVPDASSVALHYDGSAWQTVAGLPPNGGAYFKVWGSSATDVFVVGQYGKIFHWDGNTWSPQDSGLGPNVSLLTVAGRSSSDIYAVGGTGIAVALHYDGQAWSKVAGLGLDNASGLTGVSVAASGDVSMTGLAGAKFRKHGSTWTDDSQVGSSADLHGTWLDGPDDVFAVGGDLNAPPKAPRNGVVTHFGQDLPSRP
jgi:hypothetical protein